MRRETPSASQRAVQTFSPPLLKRLASSIWTSHLKKKKKKQRTHSSVHCECHGTRHTGACPRGRRGRRASPPVAASLSSWGCHIALGCATGGGGTRCEGPGG